MKEFRIIIVGCGGMSNEWIKYAKSREDTEIVGLVDIYKENAKKIAASYNLTCGIFSDINEAISQCDANLVFDVTIPASHKSITTAALSAGLNVLGEKPMAASMEEAKEMVLLAGKKNKTYAVMQNRRYLKNIRAFKDIIVSGAIGEPGCICADFFVGPHFGGFRDIMDSPLILDMAIHTFDQARFISGGDPVSVYCHEFNPPGSWYRGNAAAVCIFEFSNGAVFCYRGSWCAEGFSTSWEAEWRVTGSKGTAVWDGLNMPVYESPSSEGNFINPTNRIESGFEWTGREGHFGCLDEMFSALMEGRKAETDCMDNIKSMAMVFGAIESAKKGEKVIISI